MIGHDITEQAIWHVECEVARLDAMKRSITPHEAIELRMVAEQLKTLSDEVLNAD